MNWTDNASQKEAKKMCFESFWSPLFFYGNVTVSWPICQVIYIYLVLLNYCISVGKRRASFGYRTHYIRLNKIVGVHVHMYFSAECWYINDTVFLCLYCCLVFIHKHLFVWISYWIWVLIQGTGAPSVYLIPAPLSTMNPQKYKSQSFLSDTWC